MPLCTALSLVGVGSCMPVRPVQSGEVILFDSERDGSATGDQSIYVMDLDGSNVRRLAHVERVTSWLPDGSPDRRRIAFSSNRTGPWDDVYVMDANGGNVRQLTNTPNASEHDANWSPNGRHIVYSRAEIVNDRRQNAHVWIVTADGSAARPLTSGRTRNMNPAWSPDGSRIAFSSDRHADFDAKFIGTDEGDLEIYVMTRDGSEVRRLTECGGSATSAAWSPDGRRIAFSCNGLHLVNVDGTNQRHLIDDFGFRPVWSVDGSRIAYNCNPYSRIKDFDQFEVCVVDVNDLNVRILTRNDVLDAHPDWW